MPRKKKITAKPRTVKVKQFIVTEETLEAACCGFTAELAKALNNPAPGGEINIYGMLLTQISKHWTPVKKAVG